jgi:hypothetical protein
MRKFEAKLGNLQGTLGRIRDEGPDGAAIRGQADYTPDIDFPKEIRRFHQAWLDLDYGHRTVLWLDFVKKMPAVKKFEEMGMSKPKYYRTRREALRAIAMSYRLYE